jgi:hypothetical protein
MDKFDKSKGKLSFEEVEEFVLTAPRVNLGTLPPGTSRLIGPISFPGKTNLRFHFEASARNGGTTQLLRMKLIDNKWVMATKVTKSATGAVIYEKTDKEYPKDPNGNVLWD